MTRAAAEIYNTLLLARLLEKRPEIVSLRREIAASRSQGVLTKPQKEICGVATGNERDFFSSSKQLPPGVDFKSTNCSETFISKSG